MPDSGDNPRFQLIINNQSIAIGAMSTFGVISAGLSWVRRDPTCYEQAKENDPEVSMDEHVDNCVHVNLGGLDTTTDKHVDWNWTDLKVGDEVTIRILPPGLFDEPVDSDCDPNK